MIAGFQLMSALASGWPHLRRGAGLREALTRGARDGGVFRSAVLRARGGPAAGHAAERAAAPVPRTDPDHFAAVSRAVLGLPTEVFHSAEQLARLPAGELKALLRRARIDPGPGAQEKAALVAALLDRADTSSQQCSICCDDYVPGDVLRALPRCQHKVGGWQFVPGSWLCGIDSLEGWKGEVAASRGGLASLDSGTLHLVLLLHWQGRPLSDSPTAPAVLDVIQASLPSTLPAPNPCPSQPSLPVPLGVRGSVVPVLRRGEPKAGVPHVQHAPHRRLS